MTKKRNDAAPPIGPERIAPTTIPIHHKENATAIPINPPRRRIDRRIATTPPGRGARRREDDEGALVTSSSYDVHRSEVGHRWSTSHQLTVLAAVFWLCVLMNEGWVWGRLAQPVIGECGGVAEITTDPKASMNGISVVLAYNGHRYQVNAYGSPAWRLSRRLAGERIRFHGTCGPLTGRFARTARIAHVIGRIDLQYISEGFSEGSGIVRAANRMRRAMVRGVDGMSPAIRSLFTGLVIGDDRAQPREMINDFRASGLSHLTAVSGQNVSYLLIVVSPILKRLSKAWTFVATIVVLAWFVVLTRAEPSVLRAAFMALVVAFNSYIGRPQNARAVLALTVIGLLVIDPLLAWSVGFALSVGATAGLAWFSARITKMVGGREVLAATLAAQLGTAPISLAVFGSMPIVALVANPLVIGIAGFVMMAGLPLALIAGLAPPLVPLVSAFFAVPVSYVAHVAHVAATLSPPPIANALAWVLVIAAMWHWHRQSVQ